MTAAVWGRRGAAALLAGVVGVATMTQAPDLGDFARLGGMLLSGRVGAVYDTVFNQAGPVQLVVSRALIVGGRPSMPSWVTVAAVNAALMVIVMTLCKRLTDDTGKALAHREIVASVLTLLWLAAPLPWNGHPVEVAVPVLWTYGIVLQRGKRFLLAVAALALGIAIAPWAVLGLPCLLAAPGWRRAVRTGALAAALGVLCYLPFVLSGHFAMFEVRWTVSAGTLASLAGMDQVTWWLRLIQGAVVAAGVALAARRYRDERLGIVIVPLVAALLRVATDPKTLPYYWTPVAVLTLLLFAMLPSATATWRRMLAAGLGYLALLSEAANWTVAGAFACLLLLLALSAERPPAALSGAREGFRRENDPEALAHRPA